MKKIQTKIKQFAEGSAQGGYLIITGRPGQGKSSVIAHLIDKIVGKGADTAFHFVLPSPGPRHQAKMLLNLMTRLICKYNLDESYIADKNLIALRGYFFRVLEDVSSRALEKKTTEIIFIDGLDHFRDDIDELIGEIVRWTTPNVIFVLTLQHSNGGKMLGALKNANDYTIVEDQKIRYEHYPLPDLDSSRLTLTLQEQLSEAVQGDALYLDLIAQGIEKDEFDSAYILHGKTNCSQRSALSLPYKKRNIPIYRLPNGANRIAPQSGAIPQIGSKKDGENMRAGTMFLTFTMRNNGTNSSQF